MSSPAARASIDELTEGSFDSFGKVIAPPQSPPDATGPGWRWWGETQLLGADGRPFGVGYLDLVPSAMQFTWAERHMHSQEAIVPLGGDCLVYVGPSDHADEPQRLPALDSFKVYRVRAGQGVILDPGVWHGAPLAVERPVRALVLLLEGTGANDTAVVRFDRTPVEIFLGDA